VVPLNAVAHFAPTTAPIAVNHQGQFPSVTSRSTSCAGRALSDAVGTIQQMEQTIKMPGRFTAVFPARCRRSSNRWRTMWLLILAALAAVYIVLGILYESYIHPITILSTLPSAGVGAVLALMLFRTDLSVIAIIGMLLLIGIVKKNAIMMIDFALAAERDEGKNSRDAIFRPACCGSGRF
jgi:multidrug efflux pump subunit AcrB